MKNQHVRLVECCLNWNGTECELSQNRSCDINKIKRIKEVK